MKIAGIIIILLGMIGISQVDGQVRRTVLLEEATNASCAPCAANNPNLQAFFQRNFGGVISVRYHAWWPGSDPMYSLNTADNSARINYYSISGVPNYLIDGNNNGVPGDPGTMTEQMWDDLEVNAPVIINVKAQPDKDSVRADVTVIGVASFSQSDLYLRTAVIERMVVYDNPPGSNGETVFPDVMRKMVPDAQGVSVASINVGDTLHYSFSTAIDPAWNAGDLAVVAWLQSDNSREVIQSGISLPTYIIDSSAPRAEFLDYNQNLSRNMWIYNDNPDTLHLRIRKEEISVPAQWNFSMVYQGQAVDSFDVTLYPLDSVKFEFNFQTDNTPASIRVGASARNLDDPYGYGFSRSYFGIIPSGNVLLVDDDGGESYENGYMEALDSAGVDYMVLEEADFLNLNNQISAADYPVIFWNASWAFPAFVPADISFLTAYLDNGGNLYLAGQDVGWDIFEGGSNFPAAVNFYNNYLDADYVADNSNTFAVEGIPGDPITDGMFFGINTVYPRYPESIASYSGKSVMILKYFTQEKYGALRYDSGTYKVVYIGFGLEQMNNTETARLLIQRSLEWFGIITGIPGQNKSLVENFNLAQNYPNPFNPETIIQYSLPNLNPEAVRLVIHNSLGQRIRTLVNEEQSGGQYRVRWDGKNDNGKPVGSGIYYYQLISGDRRISRKMILMR